jgi:hypothetical protein
MDFTAYYTAGEVQKAEKNIYENQIVNDWDLWDGVSTFKHSRFLYPPSVAYVFEAFRLFDYRTAKIIWNILNIIFCFSSVWVLLNTFNLKKDKVSLLIYGILLLNFFPLYSMIERGQISGLALLLICFSIKFSYQNNKNISAGILFALATFIKFNLILALPFFIVMKKWKLAGYYLASMIGLVLLTVLLNGKDATYNYFINELPRITEYSESGTDEMKIPSEVLSTYFQMAPEALSFKDKVLYKTEYISFNSKASLIWVLDSVLEKVGIVLSNKFLSVIIYLSLFAISFNYLRKKQRDGYSELIKWQLILLIVLLSSTFTWVMNLVWLIPIILIITNSDFQDKENGYLLGLLAVGFIFSALPDNLWVIEKSVFDSFYKLKYVISEIIIFISLIFVFKKSSQFKLPTS